MLTTTDSPHYLKTKRIYQDRIYVIERWKGLSGFQDKGMEYMIMLGATAKARLCRNSIIGEYVPDEGDRFFDCYVRHQKLYSSLTAITKLQNFEIGAAIWAGYET